MTSAIFDKTRALFDIPEGVIYLDGNSLGALPRATRERVASEVTENWGKELIRAWNTAGWVDLPAKVGNRIGQLIGAPAGSVMATDSTSVNLFKALTAALRLSAERGGDRKVILSDTGNFPSDLYIAEGVISTMGQGHTLKIVAPDAVEDAITDEIAVLMLTEVDYATGRLHDMKALTARAKAHGVITIWDLAHSAGAFPVDLTAAGADFAIGCGYKYLNGGPGAPAFIYVRPDLHGEVFPSISGWFGHDAPFKFELGYRPSPTIDRMRAGTPPVLSLAALDTSLSVWDGIRMEDVRARSIELCEHFIAEVEARCPMLALASPRDPNQRGSQVSFRFEHGYAVMQALIADLVIGDFRAPDIIRFGFTPLYVSLDDVTEAARRLEVVMNEKRWQNPEYQKKGKVT